MNFFAPPPLPLAPDSPRFHAIAFRGEPGAARLRTSPAQPPPTPPSLPAQHERLSPDYARLFESLCAARGLTAAHYRASAVRRRERACLRALGAPDTAAAAARLAADPGLADRGLAAVLIGVTHFFRDHATFAALADQLAAYTPRPLTVLSIACSDGSELYSAGITLAGHNLLADAAMHGVDCRPAAIAAARAGVYPGAGIPERWLPGGRIHPDLASRARWHLADAFTFPTPAAADIILCRNFAIYLRPDAAHRLWDSVAARLVPGGLLMAGKAERPSAAGLTRVGPCLFRKSAA